MRLVASLLFCILISSFIANIQGQNSASSTSNPVSINYVSTSDTSISSTLTGSFSGGTALYIQGIGFDSTFQNNIIYVGNNICSTTAKGVTQTNIVCYTSPYVTGQATSNLQITILVLNKQPYTCSTQNCLFSYTSAQTPTLNAIYPRASSANQWVNFFGTHRISDLGDGRDMGDVIGLYIGENLCTRFDIGQASITPTSDQYIACSVVTTQQGGYYPIKQWVTPGIARNSYRMNFGSILNNAKLYNFIVSPAISSLSSHAGGSQGDELTITGTGFSIQPKNISVSVAGIPCLVSSSSATQIQCKVQKDPTNINYGKLSTSVSQSTNGFIQGTGFTYARYDTTNLKSQTITSFREKIGVLSEQLYQIPEDQQNTPKIIGQLQSPPIFADGPSKYGQTAKGYFIAPNTGNYTFKALADDALQVFISPIKGSQQGIDYSKPLLKSTDWSHSYSNTNYYIVSYPGLTSAPIEMTAGDAYYMQVYHLSFQASGYFKVSVQVPNTDSKYPNQVYEVQKIEIKPDVVPQILVFNVSGVNNGTIAYKIQILDPKTATLSYNVTSTLSYNANAAQFRTMLNSFASFSGFNPFVVRLTFDQAGNPTDVAADIHSYIYTVTLALFRPASYSDDSTTKYIIKYDLSKAQHLPASSIKPQVTYSKTQQHSPPVGGTFSLTYDNVPIEYSANNLQFPSNIDVWTLSSKINSFFRLNSVEVSVIGNGHVNGNTWIISYVGILGNIPNIVADGSKLTGGKENTIPTITVSTLRQGSTNLFVQPVTTQFLGVPADKSQVIVKVNGAVSRCLDDCSYVIDAALTPNIASASLTDNILTLQIQSTTVPTLLKPYVVKFNQQICTFQSATTSQYVCKLPTNNNDASSPVIEAGSYKPTLYIENKGYANNNDVTPITTTLSITSLTPSTGSINGGTTVTLTGVGLPISSKSIFTLKQCNINVEILSVSNTQIQFVSAPCASGPSTVNIEFNGSPVSKDFTYQALPANYPIVNNISPKTYSPVLKGFLNITGQNFGNVLSQYTVWLNKDNTNVYQLNVLEVTDTNIYVRIPGGLPGIFKVIVRRNGFGFASLLSEDINNFEYGIFVNTIQPSSGSINGGTILTITGQNFSPVLKQNQVYIGNAINWNCDVLTATTTQITCRTPQINSNYSDLSQDVVVVGRAMVDASCKGNCKFNYINSSYPTVQKQSSNFIAGQSVTLTGTGLKPASVAPKVYIGTTSATVTDSSDTSVTFTFPSLQNGTYNVNVYVDGLGYASPTFSTDSILSVTQISPPTGSTVGGTIYLKGNGLVNIGNPYLVFTATSTSADFSYTLRTDNTATQFGINYLGCTTGSSITLNYVFNKTSLSKIYNCKTTDTPTITLSTASLQYNSASQQITFTKTSHTSIVPDLYFAYPVDSNNKRFGADIQLNKLSEPSATTFVVDATPLTVGKYAFKFVYNTGANLFGIASIASYLTITSTTTPTISSNVDSAYTGGAHIQVNGQGLSSFSALSVGGIPAKLVTATTNKLVYSSPALVTSLSQEQFNLVNQQVLTGTFYSDTAKNNKLAFDGLVSTLYSSAAALCYIGLDFGLNQQAHITKIRFYPNPTWKSAIPFIKGATISASNDGTTWTILTTLDSTVHTGWNIWKPETPLTATYRYVAFKHNSTSLCNLAEFEISGYLYANGVFTNLVSNQRSISLNSGVASTDFAQKVNYKSSISPIVTKIQPRYASPQTPTNIKITGTGFGTITAQTSVVIDGITCNVQSVTDIQIVCVTGVRSSNPQKFSFIVSILGNVASIKTDNFMYAYRWSDSLTWGGDLAPIDGDTVYVPKGMVLLVDQSTPILYLLLVEGTIIFADESAMTIQSTFIIIEHGVFQAGTQAKAYQNELTFILHGDYYGTQLPGFGNKVIGCHSCTFDLHGAKRDKTWTQLSITAQKGQTVLKLLDAVDWKVGEKIVVASSSFDHTQSEELTIQSVSANKKQITVTTPLKHNHLSVVETYGTDSVTMRAEVGLISRNIKIQGDSSSVSKNYGAHVMMHGLASHGLVGRIQYTEFTHCGQPAIVGRYCIHFHMNGDVSDSYVRGNAVHHSFARVLTLHAVYYLTVEHNVGYWVKGHNIFLEDGIEQYNVIQYNLMISSLQVFNMLQTDISVASYWITNPLNTVRFNHAAGSDFYGLWYEIKPHPDGASATTDICPTGLPLGESHDNVAHSNDRFGLRIFQLWSSQNPCNKIRDNSLEDPWSANPSIQNKFYNFVLWRNAQDGLLIERVGNTIFQNITVVDSARAGIEFYKTNYTKQPVVINDCVVIAKSQNNGMPEGNYSKTSGLITSRTDGTQHNNVRFYNFPNGSTVISVAAKNTDMLVRATGGKSYFFNNIKLVNISQKANYMEYIYTRRFIIYDQDGSLSTHFDGQTRSSATITPFYHHNSIPGVCNNATTQARWNNSLICGPNVVVNNLDFGAASPLQMFQGTYMSVRRLENDLDVLLANDTQLGTTWVFKTDAEQHEILGFPFVSGYTYSAWWSTGIDWTSITMKPSYYFKPTDNGFVIRFNYTAHRELFDIRHIIAGKFGADLLIQKTQKLNYTTCQFGDYYLDAQNRYLFVCVSGKVKTTFDLLNLNGIPCRFLCPKQGGDFEKEKFVRYWSNATQWPEGRLPAAGDNVTVNGNWSIMLDIDVVGLDNLTIDGDVFLTDQNRQLSANFIWIRYGSLNAGNATNTFEKNFTITLNGQKQAKTYTIDEITTLNKYIVVTGKLNLYGKVPSTITTRLSAIANIGDTTINVLTTSGWAVGNTIGIAPSWGVSHEYEAVTITALTATTVTFTPALNFSHYGQGYYFNNTYGSIDMRATVGLFDRNIKIQKGQDVHGWGYGVLMYAWNDGAFVNVGSGVLQGVQFISGGQYDTLNSAFGIINTIAGAKATSLTGSSFQNCHDYCIYISNSNQATIDNNYIFVGKKFLVYAENSIHYTFTNNILVGATNRSSMIGSFTKDDVACYSQYTGLNWAEDNNKVQNNSCQGSQGTGFNLPHTPCDYLGSEYGFTNNVAGSSEIGFLLSGHMDCVGGQKLKAYACQTGVVTNPRAKSFVWDKLMFTDCKRAIGLRFGGVDQANNSMFWSNSYISAISRPNCSICYKPGNTPCKNLRAVRLLALSQNTEQLPKIFGDGFQVICKAELFDGNAWIRNVTFENYKTSYTGAISSYCSNNMLFQSHPIDDSSIGNHHFYGSKCTNCDTNALGHYDPPIESHFGWLGGCGNFPCTGRSNYLIHDHDGGLLGYPGIIIPNNTNIGNNTQNCIYNKVINGHICNRTDFARLKYTSITSDFKSRIMWPVNLTYEGGNWTTSTNGWREWGWDGDEPLNTRMGRFLSIVQLYKIYNMTFEAQPPTDMLFSFSLPSLSGDNSQWVGIKIYYPIPNAISVVNQNGTSTKSILATDNDNITNYVNQCGAHKYFYKNNTIHFIVTADAKCTVRVTLTSSVQVTARLSVNINTFYDTIGVTTFLDQMSAFLGITTDRLKIVGIYEGSTVIDYVVLPPVVPVDQSSTAVPNSQSIVTDLRALADKISNAKPSDFPSLPNFVGASATTNIINVNGEAVINDPINNSKSDNTKFIIIGVVVGVAVVVLIGVSIYLIVNKLRNKNPIIPQQSPDHFKQQASNDAIKADNRSQFQLRPIDMAPQQRNRIHPV